MRALKSLPHISADMGSSDALQARSTPKTDKEGRSMNRSILVSVTLIAIAVIFGAGALSPRLAEAQPYSILISDEFHDEFDGPPLPPEWVVVDTGRGSYSLTDRPGYLRYHVDAEYVDPISPGYAEPTLVTRPFSGQDWTLTTRITYDLRPGAPTNNRHLYFFIREPGGYTDYIMMKRSIGAYDSNPASNSLVLYAYDAGAEGSTPVYFPNSPGPLPPDTVFFEVSRDGDHFVIRASTDGNDSTFEHELDYTFPPGVFGDQQEIAICGGGWHGAPGGRADVDFVKVTSTSDQPPSVGIFEQDGGSGKVGEWADFTATYSDPDGYADIAWAFLFLNHGPPAASGGLAVAYEQSKDHLYLLGGGACHPGTNRLLVTQHVIVDCRDTSVSGVGDTLTINLAVGPLRCFAGGCGENTAYEYVSDSAGLWDFGAVGTWTLDPASRTPQDVLPPLPIKAGASAP